MFHVLLKPPDVFRKKNVTYQADNSGLLSILEEPGSSSIEINFKNQRYHCKELNVL